MKKRIRQYAFHVGRVTLHVSRWTLYVSAVLLVLFTIAFVIARFLLPTITEHKPDLELYLSQRSGHPVRIESLHAYWEGLHPGARAQGLQVYAVDGTRPAIRLSEVRLSLSLLPLLWGKFEINSLVVVNPSLSLERLKDGRFRVSGFDSLQETERGQGEQFIGWLFQQGRLEIENGELQWSDHREGGSTLHLTRVQLSLRNNGDRHRLDFKAEFPPGLCDDCSLALDITGNPLASMDWHGDIFLQTRQVNIKALPLIAREKLPNDFRGKFNLRLTSDWEQGRPVSIKGRAQVSDLRLPLRDWETPLDIREAGGDVSWRMRRSGWRLDVANPKFGLSGPAWAGGHLRIVYQPEESEVQIKHMDVADITGFVLRQKKEIAASTKQVPGSTSAWLDTWLAMKPGGSADNFKLHLKGDWLSPREFSLETDIRDGIARPHQNYPGVRGLGGHLSLSRDNGNFRINANAMTLLLPRVFREPLAAERVSGDVSWEKYADYWLVNGSSLRLSGEDGRGTGKLSLHLPHDPAVSPILKLRVDFQDGNGARASRYFPFTHLSPQTLAWMERSFLGGEITKGYLIYDGPIREFPFDHGTGKFELRGHVRRAVYSYLPGWEPIRQAEADVALKGSAVTVTGTGKIGKLDATQVVVHSRASGDGHHVVHVGGKLSGPLDETLKVLHSVNPDSGTRRWLTSLPSGLQGSGNGLLSLDITIPLSDVHQAGFQGEYRFMKNALQVAGSLVAVEDIEGHVRFTETGIRDGQLRARILGGETVLAAARQQDRLVLRGEGAIMAQSLAPMVGAKIAPHLSGRIDWSGSWQWGKETGDFRAEANLRGFRVALPPPLNRPEGLGDDKLVVQTESTRRGRIQLGLRLGDRLSGNLVFAQQGSVWIFSGGRIGFGQENVAPPKERELHISAHLGAVDFDQWWPFLGGGGAVPAPLTHVSAEVQALTLFDRQFGQVSLDFFRKKDTWSGSVNGTTMAGRMQYSAKGAAGFELNLERLAIPEKIHQRNEAPVDPRRLPSIVVRSQSFTMRDKPLGELDFMAVPVERGWRIRRFNLTRPEMKLHVSGNWLYTNNADASDFDIEFESSNLGEAVTALGAPDQVTGGEAHLKGKLSWPGSPTTPKFAELNGELDITAKKGRFVQVKATAGRLFGLLDLSAIGRYLTLDFSPVFGKGFIYDQIQ
ncbi:MAG: TIGR02099 family protein, partial [Sulfuricaulis sp.]|nr:TIGR02099 family protein [Sulfuricaulis sp.]